MRSIFDNVAKLRAFPGATIPPSQEAYCLANGTAALGSSGGPQRMIWLPGSSSPDNNQGQLVVVPTVGGGSGRWIRRDTSLDLLLPVSSASTDALSLLTVPDEITLQPLYSAIYLEITTIWAGGINSTIGLSYSTPSVAQNKGNLAGAVAGNGGFTATFFAAMTLGSQFAAGLAQAVVLSPTSQIFFDRIVSAFTSGAGLFHVPCYNYATTITPAAPP